MGKIITGTEAEGIVKEAFDIVKTWPQDKKRSFWFLAVLMSGNAGKGSCRELWLEECMLVLVCFFRHMFSDSLTVSQCLDLAVENWCLPDHGSVAPLLM